MFQIRIKSIFVDAYKDKLDYIYKLMENDYFLKMKINYNILFYNEENSHEKQIYRTEKIKNKIKEYYGKENVEFKNIYLICG